MITSCSTNTIKSHVIYESVLYAILMAVISSFIGDISAKMLICKPNNTYYRCLKLIWHVERRSEKLHTIYLASPLNVSFIYPYSFFVQIPGSLWSPRRFWPLYGYHNSIRFLSHSWWCYQAAAVHKSWALSLWISFHRTFGTYLYKYMQYAR